MDENNILPLLTKIEVRRSRSHRTTSHSSSNNSNTIIHHRNSNRDDNHHNNNNNSNRGRHERTLSSSFSTAFSLSIGGLSMSSSIHAQDDVDNTNNHENIPVPEKEDVDAIRMLEAFHKRRRYGNGGNGGTVGQQRHRQ